MTALTVLLNPRAWFALALAAALAFAGVKVYGAGEAHVQTAFDQWKLTAEENRQLAAKAQRIEQERRQTVNDKEADDASQKLVQARADVLIANAAHDRVRDQLAAFIAAVHRASQDPGAAAGGARVAGADPLDLLADLYSRSDEAAGAIAGYADELRIRGLAAEHIADGLQPPNR